MDQRNLLNERLLAIVTASRTLVKRLKRVKASHVLTAQFVNIGMSAMSLLQRTDYLLPTFRRYVMQLEQQYDRAVQEVQERYTDLGQELPPTEQIAAPMPERTKTVRVSITLREDDWRLIDYYIRNGHVKSYAAYFRRLVRRDNDSKG